MYASVNQVSIASDGFSSLRQHYLSHYLNQCCFIVDCTLRNQLQWNFNQNMKMFIHKNASENIVCEMAANFSRGRWAKATERKRCGVTITTWIADWVSKISNISGVFCSCQDPPDFSKMTISSLRKPRIKRKTHGCTAFFSKHIQDVHGVGINPDGQRRVIFTPIVDICDFAVWYHERIHTSWQSTKTDLAK